MGSNTYRNERIDIFNEATEISNELTEGYSWLEELFERLEALVDRVTALNDEMNGASSTSPLAQAARDITDSLQATVPVVENNIANIVLALDKVVDDCEV